MSYIRFIARPNAPTYPDADHSAARPMTSAKPAGVPAARWAAHQVDAAPGRRLGRLQHRVDGLALPDSPTREIRAMSAGNIASTA